jgi:hypothetical protein
MLFLCDDIPVDFLDAVIPAHKTYRSIDITTFNFTSQTKEGHLNTYFT